MMGSLNFSFFFFNDTATTEIYTLSLHDALPIARGGDVRGSLDAAVRAPRAARERAPHYAGIRQHPAAGRAHRAASVRAPRRATRHRAPRHHGQGAATGRGSAPEARRAAPPGGH